MPASFSPHKTSEETAHRRRERVILTVATLFCTALWFLGAWILFDARLLHLNSFAAFATACAAFFLVLIASPILLLVMWAMHFLEKATNTFVGWLIAIQLICVLFLGLVHVITRPAPVNKELFAEEITLEQLCETVAQKAPGIYFVSAWQESGSFYPSGDFFAAWLDFPQDYTGQKLYFYHSYDKTPEYPRELAAFLKAHAIDKLPAAVAVDEQGKVSVFQGLDYSPIFASETEATHSFRQYLTAQGFIPA